MSEKMLPDESLLGIQLFAGIIYAIAIISILIIWLRSKHNKNKKGE